jgi:HEAT repeat protein
LLRVLERGLSTERATEPTYEEERMLERGFEAIGSLGPKAAPLVPLILKTYAHDEYLAEVLGTIGPQARAAVPDLVKLLDNSYPVTRAAALKALSRIDPQVARASVPIPLPVVSRSYRTTDRTPCQVLRAGRVPLLWLRDRRYK